MIFFHQHFADGWFVRRLIAYFQSTNKEYLIPFLLRKKRAEPKSYNYIYSESKRSEQKISLHSPSLIHDLNL